MLGTVLVIEDHQATVDMIRETLEMDGYAVLQAVGEGGLALARRERPAAILLDINMPGMNGIEVSQRLRADPATAGIPIIAMSAGLGHHGPPPGLLADDYLAKPFDLDDLATAVARWAAAPQG